jgi:hypothetical protein
MTKLLRLLIKKLAHNKQMALSYMTKTNLRNRFVLNIGGMGRPVVLNQPRVSAMLILDKFARIPDRLAWRAVRNGWAHVLNKARLVEM